MDRLASYVSINDTKPDKTRFIQRKDTELPAWATDVQDYDQSEVELADLRLQEETLGKAMKKYAKRVVHLVLVLVWCIVAIPIGWRDVVCGKEDGSSWWLL